MSDPYTTPAGISKSGTVALANAQLDAKSQDISDSVGRQMITLAEDHSTPQLEVRLGGQLIQQAERPSLSGEGIGILAAIIILLIAFGSVLAMVLPIVVALAGIAVGLPIIGLLTHVYPLQSFSTTLATMIGIGVGIDYALFVVTRYRQGLQAGLDPEEAVITAVDTSGRAVLFAGLTVIIALLGMLAIGLSFISGLGIGAAAVVAVTVASAVTLLPAVLGFVGTNIDKLRLPWVHNDGDGTRETMWHRWSRFVQNHAWVLTIAGLAIVLALALPVLSLRLGFVDAGNDPAGSQTRQAYDLLAKGFGPGFNGPFLFAIEMPAGGDHTADLADLQRAIAATPGVASVSPALTNPAGTTAVMRVSPTTAPQDDATTNLLHHLRRDVIPQADRGHRHEGLRRRVLGADRRLRQPARSATPAVHRRRDPAQLPVAHGGVPIDPRAAQGRDHEPAVGRRGVRRDRDDLPVGLGQAARRRRQAGADPGVPADHDVRHPVRALDGLRGVPAVAHPRGVPAHRQQRPAVADGLSATARVITAAAAIMCTFFLSFVLGDNIIIKLFGIGFASAIFIDATLIRMVIVPVDDGAARRRELVAAGLARSHPPPPRRRGTVDGAGSRTRRRLDRPARPHTGRSATRAGVTTPATRRAAATASSTDRSAPSTMMPGPSAIDASGAVENNATPLRSPSPSWGATRRSRPTSSSAKPDAASSR